MSATINFYLDKTDKKGNAPIFLRINCNGKQAKISIGEKIAPKHFDKDTQLALTSYTEATALNNYLCYLKDRANELINKSIKKTFTAKEIKNHLHDFVHSYKEDHTVNIVEEQLPLYGKGFSFIDFFAGAGGFSEGFLQAEIGNKYFDFLGANDINENCELTHIVRYNHQLGLDAYFLCKDITDPDFIPQLKEKIGDRTIDVICGGPPCQSFSLAGKRRKFDKKDDLFSYYLEVIKILKPKYFVMENVKGILTKEKGQIKELILKEIKSIIDNGEIPKLSTFIRKLSKRYPKKQFILECILARIEFEGNSGDTLITARKNYINKLTNYFKNLTPKIVDYHFSKTDEKILTIRHGLNLLSNYHELAKIRRNIIKQKDNNYLDNDYYVEAFDNFIGELDASNIVQKIEKAFQKLNIDAAFQEEVDQFVLGLHIYSWILDDCFSYLQKESKAVELEKELEKIMEKLRLYNINAPFVANAANYGVPQNRERVLFIGCRKDQKLIEDIPATVSEEEKVKIFEALYDLDFIGNNTHAHNYAKVNIKQMYNGTATKMQSLLKDRTIDGKIVKKTGKTYSQWSREGRLSKRFANAKPPFYVKNSAALKSGEKSYDKLHNHKTSNQKEEVVKRLETIIKAGDYKLAKGALEKAGLRSKKRNYNLLDPEKLSSTVMTIPDDYIHYNSPRALTVREMARLQSFDDSFVFQGKRSTGGNKRKTEVPQYTLVGNAVPPLLARAVAMEILKNIK